MQSSTTWKTAIPTKPPKISSKELWKEEVN